MKRGVHLRILAIAVLMTSCGRSGGKDDSVPPTPSSTPKAADANPAPAKPAPSPALPQPPVPPEKDITVYDKDGKPQKLSTLVAGKYLVMTFTESSLFCLSCRGIATGIDSNSSVKQYLGGSKCGYASILQEYDYLDWLSVFPPTSSFVGSRSYATRDSFNHIAGVLGFEYSDTPTSIVIDKNAKVVATGIVANPLQLFNLCQ